MRIKIKYDGHFVAKHGMTKGKVFDVLRINPDSKHTPRYWVKSEAGEVVGVMRGEAEVVPDSIR